MNKLITCPLCKKETKWDKNPYRPFCSKKCKTVDLGFWAMGEYKVAGEPVPLETLLGDKNDNDLQVEGHKSAHQR